MAEYRNRILIVDDDEVMLNLLEDILSDTYEVITYKHAQDAMFYLEDKERIDLLILDIQMPEVDGYELLSHIRQMLVYSDTPAVFLTGVSGHEAEIKGLNEGVTDYITKPFQPDVLKARVNAVLRSAKRLDYTKVPRLEEPLSETELELLQMLALSYTNDDIAERLDYTYGYIRQMISKLLQKLKLENRKDVRAYL